MIFNFSPLCVAAIVMALHLAGDPGVAPAQTNSTASTSKPEDCKGPEEDPNTTLSLARKYIRDNQPKKAVDLVQNYLKQEPKDNDARIVLARAQNSLGNSTDARKTLTEVLREDPDNADGLLLKGILDMREGKLDEAETAFRKVIDISPQYCDAYSLLARLALRKGDLVAARTALEKSDPCCGDTPEFATIKRQIQRRTR